MKKNIAIVTLTLVVVLLAYTQFFHNGKVGLLGAESAQPIDMEKSRVEISFDYGRQTGTGSNQFAVWIADDAGKLVKTLFVTNFTAGRGGWEYRKQSLPLWVAESNIAGMTKDQVNVITGATPPSSPLRYVWYGDDMNGRSVPTGVYVVIIEATLRGENQVLYRAVLNLSGDTAEVRPAPEFSGSSTAERGMVTNVVIRWLPNTMKAG